jgi:hypothetical protein
MRTIAVLLLFTTSAAAQTTCRWVGINWTCSGPSNQTEACRWVGQNWTCDRPGGKTTTCRRVGINWECDR